MKLHLAVPFVLLSDASSAGLLPTATVPSLASASAAAASALASVQGPVSTWLNELPYLALRIEAAFATQTQSLLQQLLGLPNPELQWSYGKSPPVYPAPIGTGQGGWADAYAQAKALVARMTLEEKASLTLGSSTTNGCSGFIANISRVGFPGLCLNDAENGVRLGELVSGFSSQIHVGASWNRDLAGDRALWLGKEFKAKGINVVLGPVAGPLGRVARGGRNWEGFTNDPYLSGSLISPTVTNLQKSVIACGKHFIANEQETYRSPFAAGLIQGLSRQSVSSNLDDKTMHELYMWPFYDAVRAEIGSMMCSYNRVNNSYACQNSKTMNGLLKTELGFQGFVTSDWYGSLTGVAGNNAGLDMSMPYSQYLDPPTLARAVRNGSVAASRLDDAAVRIVAATYRFAPVSLPGMANYATVDARDPSSAPTMLQSAVEGHVLVKNPNAALPFRQPPSALNLFGWDGVNISAIQKADSFAYGYALANTQHYPDGRGFGDVDIAAGFLAVQPNPSEGPPTAYDGTLHVGGGSGGTTPAQVNAPFEAFAAQAAKDGTTLHTDFTSANPTIADPSAPCIVFINSQSLEAWDRAALSDAKSDGLVLAVANQCANTIAVVHNAGITLVDAWIDHPNVTAAVLAHLPGQESGPALVELFYGRQSFSGRLPYTIAKKAEDYGSLLNPDAVLTADNPMFPQSNFEEGLFIDYRGFLQRGVQPRFEFGYGLTYSNFSYANLGVDKSGGSDFGSLPPDRDTVPVPQGGLDSLYDVLATAHVDVTNTGTTEAAEVAQLYLGIPGSSATRQLRGFDKHSLKPGETATFQFPLRRRDLSVWDVTAQHWLLNKGTYQLMVGKSVMDLQLSGTLVI